MLCVKLPEIFLRREQRSVNVSIGVGLTVALSPDRATFCLDLPPAEELRRALDAGLATRTAARAQTLGLPCSL